MKSEKKAAVWGMGLMFLFLQGMSLFINLPAVQRNFLFADEATYYSMTQSLALDGDLEYTKKDLIRYYRVFSSGPLGIFLKKGKDEKIFYSKSFAYSLFAAPLVRIFGCNGFLMFNSLLLSLTLLMGYLFFSRYNSHLNSLFFVFTFLFASVAVVYILWIGPDFFNLFLVFAVVFLWAYKLGRSSGVSPKINKINSFLYSSWSDYVGSFLTGLAVFSKPPNIVLLIPLALYPLFKKKYKKAVLIILVFLISSFIFWGMNYLVTGDCNYQGGERKTFYFHYPLEKEEMTFDSLGNKMSAEGYFSRLFISPKILFYNIFYYFGGRFTGIVWYFFPAFLLLILFFLRKKHAFQWFILAALSCEILIYIIMMPNNYSGGGGSLANRYFLNVYPLFVFLPGAKRKLKEFAVCWVMASVFISPILISPFYHSQHPATHAKKFPFKLLPVELSLINNLPTNTNPRAFKQKIGTEPHTGWLYFLDDNFYPEKERNGYWTRGNKEAEMLLKTFYPVRKIDFNLFNNRRMDNRIKVKVGWKEKRINLNRKEGGVMSFSTGNGFKMGNAHIYRIEVKAQKGALPYFELEESKDRRNLGVLFKLELYPR